MKYTHKYHVKSTLSLLLAGILLTTAGCGNDLRTVPETIRGKGEQRTVESQDENIAEGSTGDLTEMPADETIQDSSAENNTEEQTEESLLYRENEDGTPAQGWFTDPDGTVGYCDENGYLMTGFLTTEGSRYLFDENGDMCTGAYLAENGEQYLFTEDGRQYLNCIGIIDGNSYFFDSEGRIVVGNFEFADGAIGMTDENGRVFTGCHRFGDQVYTFTSMGKLKRVLDATTPMVAITYDDGPSTANTETILEVLRENHAYATFFILGENVERCADIITSIEASGSEIANHTYSHFRITSMDMALTDQEISATSSKVQIITGNRPALMRPPTGTYDEVSCANVAAVDNGYPLILWSIDTLDWKHKDPAVTCETIRTQVKDGSIVLMHDMEPSSAEASKIIIPELIAAGYQLVTVSEMAAARGGMEPGGVYSYFNPDRQPVYETPYTGPTTLLSALRAENADPENTDSDEESTNALNDSTEEWEENPEGGDLPGNWNENLESGDLPRPTQQETDDQEETVSTETDESLPIDFPWLR